MNAWIKLLAATLLFALWGALVFTHQADPKELVMGIAAALTGLGVFHATTNGSTSGTQPGASIAELAEPPTPAEPALAAAAAAPAVAAPQVSPPAPQAPAANTLQ